MTDPMTGGEPAGEGETSSAVQKTPPEPETSNPPREKKSRSGWLAAGLALALVAWMGSGYILPSEPEPKVARKTVAERAPVAVEVMVSKAREVTDYLVSDGQAVPERVTNLRTEAAGSIDTVLVSKGDRVTEGQVLATIEATDRGAQQTAAEAELARVTRDLQSVQSLFDRGYATRQRLDEARATVTAAEAQIAQVARSLSDTNIVAPFAGVLDGWNLQVGEAVAVGREIGTLVDADPLKIEIKVPQQAVGSVKVGQTAKVTFITGEERDGTVIYVSTNANTATRTFTAEVTVENTVGIPAGISAQVRIPTSVSKAHFVSPATLSLGADGTLGIKTAEADDTVGFYPVEVVRAETKGVWVSGLPDEASIITIGQGFVDKGETIVATERAAEATPLVSRTPAMSDGPSDEMTVVPESDAPTMDVPAAATETDGLPSDPLAGVPVRMTAAQEREALTVLTQGRLVSGTREIEDMFEAVSQVQEQLNALGYDAGPVDGVMGGKTSDAIREFERDFDLNVDGEITFDLLDALAQALKDKS